MPVPGLALSPQAASLAVLRHKYGAPGELTPQDVNRRVARALAEAEVPGERPRWAACFEQALHAGFIPAGRILAGAGRQPAQPLINCFVQPLGPAHPVEGSRLPSLAEALAQTARTLALGGGVGLNFSALAPGEVLPALQAFDRAAQVGASPHVAARPGALMGVLRVDHPDLAAFIDAKASGGLTHFNLSVGLTDAFMRQVDTGDPGASARWPHLVHAAWHHGEPGVLFLDTLNRDNSLAWRETLHATNPCGEQPLPAHGSCCLGSIDLSRLVRQPFTDSAHFDDVGLSALATTAVRMLDNVIDLTSWPLEEQRLEALQTRRIGLGFTGLADALMMLDLRYNHAEGRAQAAHIACLLRDSAVQASVDLARERGCFPCFDAAKHMAPPGFASRLPAGLRQAIARHGLRNSHLLSVAPAGSISLVMADNVASGIEPAWAWKTVRPVHRSDGSVEPLSFANHAWRLYRAQQASPAGRRASPDGEAEANADADANHKDDDNTVALPAAFLTADDISPLRQVAMAEAVAPFIDAAISKTVLLPPDATPALVDRLLRHAWRHGLKGVAVYRPNPVIAPLIQRAAPCPALARA
jgi:ribonucleoside-diphosphate reductase alpha chain